MAMPLKEYLQTYYTYSKQASELARHLSYAGIGVIWVFKTGLEGRPTVPAELMVPGAFFVAALACDLLQYVLGTVIWSCFHGYHERRGKKPEDNVKAPGWLNKPIYLFFFGKVAAVAAGYALLLVYLLQNL